MIPPKNVQPPLALIQSRIISGAPHPDAVIAIRGMKGDHPRTAGAGIRMAGIVETAIACGRIVSRLALCRQC
jgi:hypothetical protein